MIQIINNNLFVEYTIRYSYEEVSHIYNVNKIYGKEVVKENREFRNLEELIKYYEENYDN